MPPENNDSIVAPSSNDLSKEDIYDLLKDDISDDKKDDDKKDDDTDKTDKKAKVIKSDDKDEDDKDEDDKDDDEIDLEDDENIKEDDEDEIIAPVKRREILAKLEADLVKGNTIPIFHAIKNSNPEAFNKLVDEYLTSLAKVDKDAHYHVMNGVLKNAVVAMAREAKTSGDDDLLEAARAFHKFIFGSTDFVPHTKLSKEKESDNDEASKLNSEREAFIKERFESVRDDLDFRVKNVLKSTIDRHIDPKSSMSDYVKKNASRETLELLETEIDNDHRFRTLLDKLWERAFSANFSKESIDKIRSTYLSKAKMLLPNVIKKTRNEALKGLGKKVDNDETPKKGHVPPNRPASATKIKEAKDIPKHMTTRDFLMQD